MRRVTLAGQWRPQRRASPDTALLGGPLWERWLEHPEYAECSTKWWSIMAYGNNLVGTRCMGWTWYTAVDMQLFLLVPVLTLAFWHLGLAGLASRRR